MLNPQQQCIESKFASFFQSINPVINPNLNQCFPQPVLPGETGLSDELEQYGVMGSNVSYDSSRDSTVINLGGNNSMVSTALDTPEKSVVTDQPLIHDSQLVRCEICNIDFNSNIVYVRHISGKRHQKKSEMLNNIAGATVDGALNAVADRGSETKRHKLVEGSATVVFMRFCTMCDIVCHSQEMYVKHLAGKKHAAQGRKHAQNGMELSVAANPRIIYGNDMTVLPLDHNTCLSESNSIKTCVDRVAWCEVCSIYCTSMEDLGIHKLGKNHQKNMKKSKTTIRVLLTGQMDELNLEKIDELNDQNTVNSHVMIEDSDTKKRKIMEGSVNEFKLSDSVSYDNNAMVAPTDMKAGGCKSDPKNMYKFARCDVCNIFCTSEDHLGLHKLGKKHGKRLEKVKTGAYHSTPALNDALGPINDLKIENATKSRGLEEDSEKKKLKIVEGIRKENGVKCVAVKLVSAYETSPTVFPLENSNERFEIDPSKINGDRIVSANPDETNKIGTDELARCEVCNIFCTSKDILTVHYTGKKHHKKLEKLKGMETSLTHIRPSIIGPRSLQIEQEKIDKLKNHNAMKLPIPNEDSEMTTEQEIVEIRQVGGAFLLCTMCNVVCNSQTVMDSHIAGQKHANLMRKLGRSAATYAGYR